MIYFANYTDLEEIYRTNSKLIYKAKRKLDSKRVILKLPFGDFVLKSEIANQKKELEINHSIKSNRITKVIDLEIIENVPVLVIEDFGGVSLRALMNKGAFQLDTILRIAIKLCKCLEDIHNSHVIHKDIKPENIILNPRSGRVLITDFGISSLLSRETTELKNPDQLEGTLYYISPEQTGRMNRSMDYRTDFYSLGVVLYELLTSRKPFESNDPMELVHSHIARNPELPHKLNSNLPEVLSKIILKLMSKSAEDRYKTHHGIIYDLEIALSEFKKTGTIHNFTIGEQDISGILKIPEKLYGRENEINTILKSYEETSLGKVNFLLVGGYSGIGKSVLINELQKPVTEKRGLFLSGKFDQYRKNIPYSAILSAFREHLNQILSEDQSKIIEWQNRIQEFLGKNASSIMEVIPELELLLGKPEPIPELSPIENKNRFNNTFLSFIRSFTKIENPLVIFLDDLQWADASSLDLIYSLLTDYEAHSILIIGSYRDNEVDVHHPLTTLIESLEKKKFPPKKIHLKALNKEDIIELIIDTLQEKKKDILGLAEITIDKTNGNPYFIGEFLNSLARNQLLKFDKKQNKWIWDEKEIREQAITSNVIDLLISKINTLNENEIKILKLASCLGSQFSLLDLLLISESAISNLLKTIWELIPKGFIEVKGNSASDLQTLIHNESFELDYSQIEFKFLHDRIRQAAYLLIDENEKAITHKKIGKHLFKNYKTKSKEELKEELVDIVNHLNFSKEIISDRNEKIELIELNLEVAKIAENSGAFSSAFNFLDIAMSIFPNDIWDTNYDLAFEISIHKVECAYICGKFEESEILFKQILQNAKTNLDKGRVYEIQVVQFANKNELRKAIDSGREGLKLFGVDLPNYVPLPLVLLEVIKATITKGRKKIDTLLHLPESTNEEMKMVARLLNHLTSPCYGTDQNLFALVVTKGVHLALKEGVTEYSAYMFGLYAALVGSKLSLFSTGERFGFLGINLSNRFSSLSQRCRANFAMGTFVYAWTKHARESFSYSLESYKLARETGDNIYSCYSIVEYCSKLVSLGENIEETHSTVSKYTDYVVKQVQDRWIGTLMLAMNYYLLNLLGKTKDKFSFSTEEFDEEIYTKQINLEGQGQMDWYHTNKAKTFYFYEEFDNALEMLIRAEEKIVYSFACIITAEQNFYYSLTLSALIDIYPKRKNEYLKKIKKNNSVLNKWAKACPANFLHKSLLVEAEIAKHQGKLEAEELYEKAISEAKKENYPLNEAIANELAGNYFYKKEKIKIAKIYLTEAYYGFERWGAIHKIKLLEEKWKNLIQANKTDILSNNITTTRTKNLNKKEILTHDTKAIAGSITTDMNSSMILDLYTVLKSSQVISKEIRLNSLLSKMIDIVMENVGAEKACFFVNEKDKFYLVANTDLNSGESNFEVHTLLQESTGFPKSIVNFVIRTKQTLVIQDAYIHPNYKSDEYVIKNSTRSILCMPILFHSKLFGIIYLENNLAAGVLSQERVELLNMLSSQIAISYNNAKMYAEMEDMAESFSRFVPKQFLEYLGKKSVQEISVGDAMRHEMTIFFSDLRNFTGMSEKMDVKDNFKFLNSYMERMEPIINNNHGFIDKYIGDAIMALFPDSPTNALKACILMKEELAKLNESRKSKGFEEIKFGIGLHTGEVMLGTIGSKSRLDTTVIGDSVNLASRLESMTKVVGTSILISDTVYDGIRSKQGFHFREIGIVKMKGKDKPTKLYEVFNADEKEVLEKKLILKPIFEKGLSLFYEKNFEKAFPCFQESVILLPSDNSSKKYLEVTKKYLIEFPSESWDGSEVWS